MDSQRSKVFIVSQLNDDYLQKIIKIIKEDNYLVDFFFQDMSSIVKKLSRQKPLVSIIDLRSCDDALIEFLITAKEKSPKTKLIVLPAMDAMIGAKNSCKKALLNADYVLCTSIRGEKILRTRIQRFLESVSSSVN